MFLVDVHHRCPSPVVIPVVVAMTVGVVGVIVSIRLAGICK
jgi:hypothetical protein